jgi:hypothetical protein
MKSGGVTSYKKGQFYYSRSEKFKSHTLFLLQEKNAQFNFASIYAIWGTIYIFFSEQQNQMFNTHVNFRLHTVYGNINWKPNPEARKV